MIEQMDIDSEEVVAEVERVKAAARLPNLERIRKAYHAIEEDGLVSVADHFVACATIVGGILSDLNYRDQVILTLAFAEYNEEEEIVH